MTVALIAGIVNTTVFVSAGIAFGIKEGAKRIGESAPMKALYANMSKALGWIRNNPRITLGVVAAVAVLSILGPLGVPAAVGAHVLATSLGVAGIAALAAQFSKKVRDIELSTLKTIGANAGVLLLKVIAIFPVLLRVISKFAVGQNPFNVLRDIDGEVEEKKIIENLP